MEKNDFLNRIYNKIKNNKTMLQIQNILTPATRRPQTTTPVAVEETRLGVRFMYD
jgi:hypothetical protein